MILFFHKAIPGRGNEEALFGREDKNAGRCDNKEGKHPVE
jgi:hypothetical protein